MMEAKKALRQRMRELKKQFSKADKLNQAADVLQQLEMHPIYSKATSIFFYWSMEDELPTQDFILNNYKHKAIYLPVIKGDDLEVVQFTGLDCLVPGDKYGIPEPSGAKLMDESIIELVIVPGVAFDKTNNRMGRGAGYYDRILSRVPEAKKIALAFDFQMVEQVPVEDHDVKMDLIIFGQ